MIVWFSKILEIRFFFIGCSTAFHDNQTASFSSIVAGSVFFEGQGSNFELICTDDAMTVWLKLTLRDHLNASCK